MIVDDGEKCVMVLSCFGGSLSWSNFDKIVL